MHMHVVGFSRLAIVRVVCPMCVRIRVACSCAFAILAIAVLAVSASAQLVEALA